MRHFVVLLTMLTACAAHAQVSHVAPAPIVTLNADKVGERICYYNDRAYSFGAIIQVGDYYMECKAANDFETNGPLKWQQIDSQEKSQ